MHFVTRATRIDDIDGKRHETELKSCRHYSTNHIKSISYLWPRLALTQIHTHIRGRKRFYETRCVPVCGWRAPGLKTHILANINTYHMHNIHTHTHVHKQTTHTYTTYMHTYTCTNTNIYDKHKHTHTHTHTYIWVHVCVCHCVYSRCTYACLTIVYVCMYVWCVRVCFRVCVLVWPNAISRIVSVCTCVCVCVCVCVCTCVCVQCVCVSVCAMCNVQYR